MEYINRSSITPDPNQPRKYFAANKMNSLKENIRKHGIKNPLHVEEVGKGKYLLVDGERRFRAATELKMDKVPVVIEKAKKLVDRLIEQFSIQEHQEAWTPVEKANAIIKIAEELGLSLIQTTKLLNIDEDTARRYSHFASLVDKENFERNEVPIDYASGLKTLRNQAIRLSENELEEAFSRADEKKLEHRVVSLIVDGDIRKRNDLTRLADSFAKNPKLIRKFLTTKITSLELYKESKAKGSQHLRQATTNGMWFVSHANSFCKIKDVKMTDQQISTFKGVKRAAEAMLNIAE